MKHNQKDAETGGSRSIIDEHFFMSFSACLQTFFLHDLVQEVGAGCGVFVLGVNLVGILEGLEDGLLDCGEEAFHEILFFICYLLI